MPGHRSPGGYRTSPSVAVPSTARSPRRPLSAPPSAARRVGATTTAAGAAFGVVASGAFAAVIPTSLDGHPTVAEASDAPATMLATQSTPLAAPSSGAGGGSGYFSPVAFAEAPGNAAPGAQVADSDMAAFGKAGKIAEKIAAEHARAAAAEKQRSDARAALDKKIAAGGLDGWIAEALDHMGMSQEFAPGLKRIILKESNGNPDAINNWDSNAAAGNPSEGLMQVIPSTFEKFVHPDFADRDVTDPVANITAGVRYMIDRYGEDTLSAGGRSSSSGGYLGY